MSRRIRRLCRAGADPDPQARRYRRARQPAAHKIAAVRAAIEAKGAQLFLLPPYSPDMNPIEMAFAKLKTLLRQAPERTRDGLWIMSMPIHAVSVSAPPRLPCRSHKTDLKQHRPHSTKRG